MNSPEYLHFIRESQNITTDTKRFKDKFVKKLSNSLYVYIMSYYRDYKIEPLSEDFMALSKKCAARVYDNITNVQYLEKEGVTRKCSMLLPRKKTKQEAQKELKEVLASYKESGEEYFINNLPLLIHLHWQDFEMDNYHINYLRAVHNIAKKVMLEFYSDEISALSSSNFKLLNAYTYMLSIEPYLNEVDELLPDFE